MATEAASLAAPRRRPRFDGERWLREHGLDFEAEFGSVMADAREFQRVLRSYSRCQPLTTPSVDVLICPSLCERRSEPRLFKLCSVDVRHVRHGRLRDVNRFYVHDLPPELVNAPSFHFTFRAEGEELNIEDPNRYCELSLVELHDQANRDSRVAATEAVMRRVCATEGRYRWTGSSFAKVAVLKRPPLKIPLSRLGSGPLVGPFILQSSAPAATSGR